MVYSSLLFIYGFLPVSLLLYYVSPKKFREVVLLILSMVFVGLISIYFLIFILAYILVNYSIGAMIQALKKKRRRSVLPLALGLIIDVTLIFAFRTDHISWILKFTHVPKNFYPIGLSFFTLSAIGTLIDIYKGHISAEKNIVKYALYIIFFPRLIMGPVLRYDIFKKVLSNRRDGLSEIGTGFTVFIKGLAKKIILADNMFILYSAVKSVDVKEISALSAWLGIIAYLLCLYFTLSGFADMATGIGYCFGFRFPQSFNYAILSSKIRYFAARWHIQIVHWFRRYITKPLGAFINKKWYKQMVFVGVWAIFGFWYTFNSNGIIWGTLIGTAIIVENKINSKKLVTATGVIYSFLVVTMCMVFLSGESVSYSCSYLLAMIGGNGAIADSLSFYLMRNYIVILLIGIYASTNLFRNMIIRSGKGKFRNAFIFVSPILVIILLAVCTALISYSGSSEMILLKL